MDGHVRMSNKLAAFSFGQLQDCANVVRLLARNAIAVDDFLSFVKEEKRRRFQERGRMEKRVAEIERRLPKCPSCEISMVLRPAGEDPGDGSHWTCPRCRFGRYDPRGVEEVRRTSNVA